MFRNSVYGIAALIAIIGLTGNKNQTEQNQKPPVHIGYYLKTLDNLLTEHIDRMHAANGLTRAEWQILNSIYCRPNIDTAILVDIVKEFTDIVTAHKLISNLIKKELVTGHKFLKLTGKGRKCYNMVFEMQKAFRRRVAKGISQSEYEQVIRTLDKMIKNLTVDK
jgi:DNA-binding MarR family transcriptional regulator